jgi:hypothetical protein
MIATDLFPTTVYKGNMDMLLLITNDYSKWIQVEKLITDPVSGSTTHSGYQRVFVPGDKEPSWMTYILDKISPLTAQLGAVIKSSWVVSYDAGGYQDPHIHASSYYTAIVNISGTGELLLFDPRPIAVALSSPFAEIITLSPGDWIAFPGWLTHSSRPCLAERNILVIDFKINTHTEKQVLT